jgi:hypothetical protein
MIISLTSFSLRYVIFLVDLAGALGGLTVPYAWVNLIKSERLKFLG